MNLISGIQQMGIGVPNVLQGFDLYKQAFGMNVKMFDDEGTAELMLPYTNGKPQNRRAILALNLRGGGGMEIWQYTTRTPLPPVFTPELGDLGLCVCKIKSDNIQGAYNHVKNHFKILCEPQKAPDGLMHFFCQDPFGNVFEVMEGLPFFNTGMSKTGGVAGAFVGVSDMEKSMKFYKETLGYDIVIYDETNEFADLQGIHGGDKTFRRVLLAHGEPRVGPFSRLLGASYIELLEAKNYQPQKLYKDRQWGDLGFIHLCFDVKNMNQIKANCEKLGYPFTVDSSPNNEKFDMGEAAGRFTYLEDPDGALIELVETYKIPIMKKWGIYLNLEKRNPLKALPDWMLRLLRFA
ncbi:MAG: VOC family protein [Bacteroidales bacterium]|jgi:catechol 2,3-dioxygenase-like lactoylglutathione lyase family enzyme|nr:VOC family protein [Bacteroidales bacterium]